MSRKSSVVIVAIAAILSFFTIGWLSCKKPGQPHSCDNIVCENGGYCYQDTLLTSSPRCACPSGYEGYNCATVSVNKYIGTWDMKEHVDWSDTVAFIGRDSSYFVELNTTSTPTTFFIDNFFNNPFYNNIICNLDSTHTDNFTMDTLSNFHMYYNHYKIKWGEGTIYGHDSIVGHVLLRFLTATSNWHLDSVTFHLVPHKF